MMRGSEVVVVDLALAGVLATLALALWLWSLAQPGGDSILPITCTAAIRKRCARNRLHTSERK